MCALEPFEVGHSCFLVLSPKSMFGLDLENQYAKNAIKTFINVKE